MGVCSEIRQISAFTDTVKVNTAYKTARNADANDIKINGYHLRIKYQARGYLKSTHKNRLLWSSRNTGALVLRFGKKAAFTEASNAKYFVTLIDMLIVTT
jgi:hypothetical protein